METGNRDPTIEATPTVLPPARNQLVFRLPGNNLTPVVEELRDLGHRSEVLEANRAFRDYALALANCAALWMAVLALLWQMLGLRRDLAVVRRIFVAAARESAVFSNIVEE